MARYINEFSVVNDMKGLYASLELYLRSEGYEYVTFENENVFKKGKGFVSGPTFIKIFQNGNNIRVEAWLKYAIFPGVYAGEMGLEGVMGLAVKKVLKERVLRVEGIIMQYGGYPMMSKHSQDCAQQQYQQQQYQQQQYQQQQYQQQGYAQQAQPATESPAFCSRCGAKLDAGACFCSKCGNAVK